MARQALKEIGLASACELIAGPCAVAIGGGSVVAVVRELLEFAKEAPAVVVRGALMEGTVFGADRVDELSRYPTLEEALGLVAGLVRSPGARLAAAALAPGAGIAGAIQALAERAEEN